MQFNFKLDLRLCIQHVCRSTKALVLSVTFFLVDTDSSVAFVYDKLSVSGLSHSEIIHSFCLSGVLCMLLMTLQQET